MILHICNSCPITKDDCGPWDDQHELFKTVFTIHKNHLGFQKVESKKTLVDHSRYVALDLMLHKLISYEKILKYFYEIHDPTTLNSQGPDFGTQYRSEIFYLNDQQKQIAEKITNEENDKLSGKIITKISMVKNYCPAEEYHQKYLEKR